MVESGETGENPTVVNLQSRKDIDWLAERRIEANEDSDDESTADADDDQ